MVVTGEKVASVGTGRGVSRRLKVGRWVVGSKVLEKEYPYEYVYWVEERVENAATGKPCSNSNSACDSDCWDGVALALPLFEPEVGKYASGSSKGVEGGARVISSTCSMWTSWWGS